MNKAQDRVADGKGASHAIYVSRPDAVAAIIKKAAGAAKVAAN